MVGVDDAATDDPVGLEYARLERERRRGRGARVERRVALAAVLVLCVVPVAMFATIVSTLRLFGDNVESPGAVHTYEFLLVLEYVAFFVAVLFGVRTGRTGVVVTALVTAPIVLVAAYVLAVPQGRWNQTDSDPGRDRHVPACFSGTDDCAEYGG